MNLATGVQNVFTAAKLVAILIVILGGMYKLVQGQYRRLESAWNLRRKAGAPEQTFH